MDGGLGWAWSLWVSSSNLVKVGEIPGPQMRGTRAPTLIVRPLRSQLEGGEAEGLGVVVGQVCDLNAAWLDDADFVAVIDNFAGAGHEDVVSMGKEGLDGFVRRLRVAEVLEVDGGRAGAAAGTTGTVTHGCAGAGALEGRFNCDGRGLGGEDVSAGSGVADVLALGELLKVESGVDAGVGELFGIGAGGRGGNARRSG